MTTEAILMQLIQEVRLLAINSMQTIGQTIVQNMVDRLGELENDLKKNPNHINPHKTDHSAYDLNKHGSFAGRRKP